MTEQYHAGDLSMKHSRAAPEGFKQAQNHNNEWNGLYLSNMHIAN